MPMPRFVKVRKRPSQERSRTTVDAILEAGAYILSHEGWKKFTTNRVAERAGVNIASLYQYFPNKESIALELERRHTEKVRNAVPGIVAHLRSQESLRAALKILFDVVIAEHRINPKLHKVISEELPRVSPHHPGERYEQQICGLSRILEPYHIDVPNLDIALFLVLAVSHAAIHEAASERPDLLSNPLFAEELATLVERYLVRNKPG